MSPVSVSPSRRPEVENSDSILARLADDGTRPKRAVLALSVFFGFVGVYLLSTLIYALAAIMRD